MSDQNKPQGTKRPGSTTRVKATRAKLEHEAQSDDVVTDGESAQIITQSAQSPTEIEPTQDTAIHEEPLINIQKIPKADNIEEVSDTITEEADETPDVPATVISKKTDDTEEVSDTVAEKADETPDVPAAVNAEEKEVSSEMVSIDDDKSSGDDDSSINLPESQGDRKEDIAEEFSTTSNDTSFIDDSSASPAVLQIDEKDEDDEELAPTAPDEIATAILEPVASESSSSDEITTPRTCTLPSMPELAEKSDDTDPEVDDPDSLYAYTNVSDIPLPPLKRTSHEVLSESSSDCTIVETVPVAAVSKDKPAGSDDITCISSDDSTALETDVITLEAKDTDKPTGQGEMAPVTNSATVETHVTLSEVKDADKPTGRQGEMAAVTASVTVKTHVTFSEVTKTE